MYYVLMYFLLAFGSSLILSINMPVISNIIIILFTVVIYFLMYKRYVNDFGGLQQFKHYHKRLNNIQQADPVEEVIIEDTFEKPQYEQAKAELVEIVRSENKYSETYNDGSEVVIDDKRFVVSAKKWGFLFLIYNLGDFYMPYLENWAFYITSILTIILAGVTVYPLIIESWHGLKNKGWPKVFLWMVLGAFALLALNVVNGIFFDLVGFEAGESANQSLIEIMLQQNFFRVAFEATVMAAFFEELIFRGVFFRSFFNKNKLLAYIITFFAFGIPHLFVGFLGGAGLSEFMFLPIYGLMGVVFAYVYDKTGSIFTAMGAHFINNLISILMVAFL